MRDAESRFAHLDHGQGAEQRLPFRARLGLWVGLIVAASVCASCSPAIAAFDHSTVEKSFTVSACAEAADIAVDEANEYIYVACHEGLSPTVKRFDFEGDPAPFSSSQPYLVGNEIVEAPADQENGGEMFGVEVSVDNSTAHPGYLYLNSKASGFLDIEIFKPSGELALSFAQPEVFCVFCGWQDVDVGSDGSIYAAGYGDQYVTKFDANFVKAAKAFTGEALSVRATSSGAIWELKEGGKLVRYEADQFNSKLNPPASEEEQLVSATSPSPLFPSPAVQDGDIRSFDVDPSTDDLYVNRGTAIDVYSPGTVDEPPYRHAPTFGTGILAQAYAVEVTEDHRVFVTNGSEIVRFGPGQILPDVTTQAPTVDETGHTEVTVHGSLDPAGGPPITECKLEYGESSLTEEVPCTPDPATAPPGSNFTTPTAVSATMTGLTTGQEYRYRFAATSSNGSNAGIERTVVPSFVLGVQTLPAIDISDSGATLRGSFDPDGIATTYHFEYGLTSGYGLSTAETLAGAGSGSQTFETPVADLAAGRVFHYRVVATNVDGTTVGEDETFRTASPPDITAVRATDVAATSATLRAKINPNGYDTSYLFEYGPTPTYGQVVPVPEADIGSGTALLDVAQSIADLQEGITYHFRVVAENEWGSSTSADTSFDFSPQQCPNNQVRQETGSTHLPDCRAYEIVSPGNAGGVVLQPGEMLWKLTKFGSNPDAFNANWAQNSGYASAPPRFGYFGALGAMNGIDSISSLLELYVTTRTNSGWVTTRPGLKGISGANMTARVQCNEAMSRCLDHFDSFSSFPIVQEAGVWDVSGDQVDAYPTNAGEVTNGQSFHGSQRPSPDFSHYVFSADNAVFAPEGLEGGIGSAYDNDTINRTVSVISRLPNGDPFMQEGEDSQFQRIWFPAISADGTHVLMMYPSSEGGYHLYLSVSGITQDVAKGAGVTFVGMTRDGSRVAFLASQQLTADDTDTSVDLYVWHEDGTLEVASQGNGDGNSDSCDSTFAPKCDVVVPDPELDHPREWIDVPGLDDDISEGSGDVYFYSPEQLDPGRAGVLGQKNLYVFRSGAVQLVSVMEPGTDLNRIQISPDGAHAAMVTRSQLTAYDNAGFKQMYTYDAEARAIRCASCDPEGFPPTSDVEASSSGRFMSDDGRAFFATKDPLSSRDTNGKVRDVYEYVDGGPQLITTGQGTSDFTGSPDTIAFLLPNVNLGLESVSHDGRDVYFSTFETLVSQDHNGAFVKFYDARSNGGFPDDTVLADCAAADECHGVDSSRPPGPRIGTGADLGAGGNARLAKKPKCPRKKVRRGKKCVSKSKSRGKRTRHGHTNSGRSK